MLNVAVEVQPFMSVTRHEYEPAVKLLAEGEGGNTGVQRYVYIAVPPVTATEAEASLPPKQVAFTCDGNVVRTAGEVTATVAVLVQVLPSVTVTV